MATAQRAIDRIAKETGVPSAPVARAALFLRKGGLWPQGEPGRGREAHVEAPHLINLVLSLAVAEPFNDGPEVVFELRDLVLLVDDFSAQASPVVTLGEALDQHVTRLARSEERGSRSHDWWHITLFKGPQFHARVYNPRSEQPYRIYLPRRFAKMSDMRASILQHEVTIKHALVLVLADLYGDTLNHQAKLLAKTTPERRVPMKKAIPNQMKHSGAAFGEATPLCLGLSTD